MTKKVLTILKITSLILLAGLMGCMGGPYEGVESVGQGYHTTQSDSYYYEPYPTYNYSDPCYNLYYHYYPPPPYVPDYY